MPFLRHYEPGLAVYAARNKAHLPCRLCGGSLYGVSNTTLHRHLCDVAANDMNRRLCGILDIATSHRSSCALDPVLLFP
jgi:hypothetical protein